MIEKKTGILFFLNCVLGNEMGESFGFRAWFLRWLAALFIVMSTYNPSGHSYYHWVAQSGLEFGSVKVMAGLSLLLLYIIYIRATVRSIGAIGVGLITSLLGASAWFLSDVNLIDLGNYFTAQVVILSMFATLISVGISWSHLRNRLSGQVDSDDVTTPPPL
jgi:sensor histidine kinase YesM